MNIRYMTTDKKDKNKLYYGIYPVPKGQKRANMEQAVTAHQIRYFGLKKVDPQLAISEVQESKIPELEKKQKAILLKTQTYETKVRRGKTLTLGELADYKKLAEEYKNLQNQINALKATGHNARKVYLQDPRYEVKNGEIVNKQKPKKIKKVPVKKAPIKKTKVPPVARPIKRKMADIPRESIKKRK